MTEYVHVITEKLFEQMCHHISQGDYIAVDTETNGLNPYQGDRLIGVSFYVPEFDIAYYVPIRHPDHEHLDWLKRLKDYYPCPDTTYVMFNSKFDLHMLFVDGFDDPDFVEDVMIAAQLYNESERDLGGSFKLKYLAKKYLGDWAAAGEEELKALAKEYGVNPKSEMWKLPSEAVWYYAALDAYITFDLNNFYKPHLALEDTLGTYLERNKVNLFGYFQMERNGLHVDREALSHWWDQAEETQEKLLTKLRAMAADRVSLTDFNPNSPSQIKGLFGMLGHFVEDTRAITLQKLSDRDDIIGWIAKDILEYRSAKKEASTYYMPYSKMVDENDYLHPNIFTVGTVTGRVSTRFHQLPRKKGYNVKKIFVPTPGYVLCQADFSNLELRLATHFAKEPTMRRMFADGIDLHQHTADQLTEKLGKPISRFYGKTANFGLLYGLAAYRWEPDKPCRAEEHFGLPLKEVAEIIEAWHATYPNFRKAYKSAQALAMQIREGGRYLTLFNGRRRHIDPYLEAGRKGPVKDALNFLVQGTGAAITEECVLRLALNLAGTDFRILLQVHDSIVFEVKEELFEEYIPKVVSYMEDWPDFDPAVKVDVEASLVSWSDFQKVNKENPSLEDLR